MMMMHDVDGDDDDDDIAGLPRRLKKQLKMLKQWRRQNSIMPLTFQGDKMIIMIMTIRMVMMVIMIMVIMMRSW